MPELTTENGVYSEPSGFKVSWFKDSDGNILSIEEQPQDADPSGVR
ncbi:MAG: hypothetical protein M3Q93_15060 [Gemmatimonadota bacterium]|nr:hypothetical protein [Gemmatimonadota bacterium]